MSKPKRFPHMPQLYGTMDAARILGCHPDHVRDLIRSGRLPAILVTPRLLRIERRSLLKLIRTSPAYQRRQTNDMSKAREAMARKLAPLLGFTKTAPDGAESQVA